jgi:hypothetical protein
MKTTRNTLYDATYQYLVDHAFKHDGKLIVSFVLPPKEKFRKKILARENGFKRQDLENIDFHIAKFIEEVRKPLQEKLTIIATQQSKRDRRIQKLKKEGDFYIRTMIKVRDWLTYRINRYEHPR